jgi:hypothetical protein
VTPAWSLPGTPIDRPSAVTSFVVEQLIGVGGTKKFSKASVSMEIVGFEFAGGQGNDVVLGDP